MNSTLAILQATTPAATVEHPGNLPTIDAAPPASLVAVRGLITARRYQHGSNRGTTVTLTDTTGSIAVFIPHAIDPSFGLGLGTHLCVIGRTDPDRVYAVRIRIVAG